MRSNRGTRHARKRRRVDERLRIAVGTLEISGFTELLAEGFERLGHQVTTAMRVGHTNFPDALYDFDIVDDVARVDWPRLLASFERAGAAEEGAEGAARPGPDASPEDRLRWLIAAHDVFVFVYGSFWADRRGLPARRGIGREYPWLRRLGKKIVSVFVGPDVRHASAYDQQLAAHESPGLRLGEVMTTWATAPLLPPLRNLRRAELYADVVLSQPNQAGLALRPYTHVFAPLSFDRIEARVCGREVPVVVHAPSNLAIKGTAAILAALERLRARGVKFELRLLHDVPNREVLAALSDADVVIDQLHLPLHGRLGCEAMAAGAALVTCNDERFEPFPAKRPIWNIDATGLEAQLERPLTDRGLRVRLAERGLRYVRRWHDHVAVVRRIVEALGPSGPPADHRPEFFARHYRPPAGRSLSCRLRRLTRRVARRYGLPEGVEMRDLENRGLA